jgi:putative phosphoribosyl transferase
MVLKKWINMFKNRKEAGELLAMALEQYRSEHPVVLGIPRGGVETAYYVAAYLNCELSVIVTRKLGFPTNREAAFGAIAEDGSLYLSAFSTASVTKEEIEEAIEIEKKEIRRRVQEYRNGQGFPDLMNRTVILVDDGIATGSTLFAALDMCRKRHPKKLVAAAPVAGPDIYKKIGKRADDLVILETPENFYAVSQAYSEFSTVGDYEVKRYLKHWMIRESLVRSLTAY